MSAIASSHPLMMRLLSASVAAANRAGEIVRDVLKSGSLGLVMKVRGAGDALSVCVCAASPSRPP